MQLGKVFIAKRFILANMADVHQLHTRKGPPLPEFFLLEQDALGNLSYQGLALEGKPRGKPILVASSGTATLEEITQLARKAYERPKDANAYSLGRSRLYQEFEGFGFNPFFNIFFRHISQVSPLQYYKVQKT